MRVTFALHPVENDGARFTDVGCGTIRVTKLVGSARERRTARLVRILGLTIFAWATATLACSRGEAPLGDVNGGAPQLANKPESCDEAPAPIPELVAAQFTHGSLKVVRDRCRTILGKAITDPPVALELAIRLAGYIREHSNGTLEQQTELANAFLCVSQSELPGEGCSFSQIPPGSNFRDVPPEGGGPFFEDDELTAYQLMPGWSETHRVVFATPGPCVLNTPFAQYPECVHYGTIPDGPFAEGGTGVLAHCAVVPDDVDTANLRIARNIDDFNDPGATDAGGSEYYPDFTPSFGLPACTGSLSISRSAASGQVGRTDGKGGAPGGVALAVTRVTQGGQISAFSDWGIVDITTPAATVEGTVVRGGRCRMACSEHLSLPATVNLFCDAGIGTSTPAGPAIVTGADGKYSFPTIGYDFNIGSTCEVRASATGFLDGSSGEFPVTAGANLLPNIALQRLP